MSPNLTTITPDQTARILSTVLAVEAAAPELAGNQKAAIVVGAINAGVAAAPAVLSLITQIVALLKAFGLFKSKAAPAQIQTTIVSPAA